MRALSSTACEDCLRRHDGWFSAAWMFSNPRVEIVLGAELIMLSFGAVFSPECAYCHQQGVRIVAA